MYKVSHYGPTFGASTYHDIFISDNALSNQNSVSACGQTYSTPSGYSAGQCGFFTGGYQFTPTDIEVFYEIGGLGESVILGDLDHNKYLGKLISYLDPVVPNAFRSEFVRCWHAKTEGSAASTFHANCDGKGPTVTIIKYGDYIFGGYTDVSWQSSGGWSSTSKAFLFSLYNAQGYNPVKLTQYQYPQYAMYKYPSYGPTFGAGLGHHDIFISDNALNNQNSQSACGQTYAIPSGYSAGQCGFFIGGGFHFTPTDIEVFYEKGLGASVILGGLDPSKYLEILISYLDPVRLSSERSMFVRCWHALTDGSAASTFHANCDGKGPTVTIVKVGNNIFGGYTDVSWYSHACAYSSDSKAFLFSLYNAQGYNPVKLTQYQNQQQAMFGCSDRGPTFGASTYHDIYISDNALSNQHSYSTCGQTYSTPSGYSVDQCGFFTGGYKFTPTDIEVFYEIDN
ncbi:uncharacterized protein LOC144660180 isoform X1 [Oculina patagonica]